MSPRAVVVEVLAVEAIGPWSRVVTSEGAIRCTQNKWKVGDRAVWVEDEEFTFLSDARPEWPLGEDVLSEWDRESLSRELGA